MSEKLRQKPLPDKLASAVRQVAGGGLGAGIIGLTGVSWRNHRHLTHQSLDVAASPTKIFELDQRSIGMNTSIWAAVHRIHHEIPDATLFPFYEIARCVQWLEENSNATSDIQIPESFAHLDPFVDSFTRDEALQIGNVAIERVKERLGTEYQEPLGYTLDEVNSILNPSEPIYYYTPYAEHPKPYSQDEIARILLTDPHSPALVGPRDGHRNGVRGVFRSNVYLFKTAADLFRVRPDLIDKDLQRDEVKSYLPYQIGAYVAFSLVALAARRRFKPEDVLIAAAVGSAINGIKTGIEVYGGNVTNSLGHAGKITPRTLFELITKRDYNIVPNPDGTISTDSVFAGLSGRFIGWSTLDEVGGQDVHHKRPDKIAFTDQKGWRAWFDVPYGRLTEFAAESPLPLINEGEQFGGIPLEDRPDMPNEGVQIIHKARVAQMTLTA